MIEVVHDITERRDGQPTLDGDRRRSPRTPSSSPNRPSLRAPSSNSSSHRRRSPQSSCDVLQLIAQGLSNAQIGKRMHLAEGTIK